LQLVAVQNTERHVRQIFNQSSVLNKGNYAMTNTANPSTLHKQAASEHEAAAKHHLKAAAGHDQNKAHEADVSAKSAMECSTAAHKHTTSACEQSAKKQ
jgi:hypothetical protein